MRNCIILSSILYAFGSSLASADPIYAEMIVFSNHSTTAADNEWIQNTQEEIRVEPDVFALLEDESALAAPPESDAAPEPTLSIYHPKPVAAEQLINIAAALSTHSDYDVINHFAWVQEVDGRRNAISVPLSIEHPDSKIVPQYMLAGEVVLYEAQRLLHAEVNATYKPAADKALDTIFLPEALTRYQISEEYFLHERRQVRINDLHYFDHPRFGVILHLTRP